MPGKSTKTPAAKPLTADEIRGIVRAEIAASFNARTPGILSAAAQNSQAICNNGGGAMMEFFGDILQEGLDLQEVIDKRGDKPNAAAPTVAEFLRIFRLGLEARVKRDTRAAEAALRAAGVKPPTAQPADEEKQPARKTPAKRKRK